MKVATRKEVLAEIAELGSKPLNPPVITKKGGREFWSWVDGDGYWMLANPCFKGVQAKFTPYNTAIADFKDIAKETP